MLEFLIKLMQMCSIDCDVMVQPWETYEKHIRNTWILRPIYSSYSCQVSEPGCNIPTTITTVYFSEAKANNHHNHRSSIPPFLHSAIPPFLHSSVPPFLPTCDVGRLQRALSLGYPRSSVQQHSAYSQDVSEKSPANTLLIFSTKMDSAPLHLSNCGSLTACNILSWPTGRQKNTPAFFMIQYTALKGR